MFGKKLSSVMLLSLALSLTQVAGAQAGGRLDKMVDALDLSDEQAAQFKAFHEDKRSQMKQHKNDRQAMQKNVADLLDNYDPQQAQALADQAADMAREMTLARLQQTHKIYSLLNDEQKQTFKEMMKKHGGKHRQGQNKGHKWGHED